MTSYDSKKFLENRERYLPACERKTERAPIPATESVGIEVLSFAHAASLGVE
jgi:hypothetical protein